MNSRAKKALTRSWQDRDWNHNRRNWCRLPVPLGKPCWVLTEDKSAPPAERWHVVETVLIGLLEWAGATVYFVGEDDAIPVSPHSIFGSPIVAAAEAAQRRESSGSHHHNPRSL